MTTFPVGGISGGKTKIAEKRKRQLRETDEDPSAKNRPKKKTYHQNFHQEYRTVYPALRSSAKGPQSVHCEMKSAYVTCGKHWMNSSDLFTLTILV